MLFQLLVPWGVFFPPRWPEGPDVELFLCRGVICGVIVHMELVISV